MIQEFLSGSGGSARPNSASQMPEREPIRIMIVSSSEGVNEQIQTFYAEGFAEVDEWSPIMPVPNSDLMMSILIRYRQRLSTDKSTRKSGR